MEPRPGLSVSAVVHGLVLGVGLVSFAVTPFETPPTEAMPVDLVPISELTELKAGVMKPTEKTEPKPVAEKVAEPKPAPEPEVKPTEKPEIKPTASAPPPPPAPKDPIKELIKDQPTPEPSREQAAVPKPPKRPPVPKQQPKPEVAEAKPQARPLDFNHVAALLDKRDPQRQRATAEQTNRTAALGASSGFSSRLTQSDIDALRAQIQACWNPPVGAERAEELIVRLRIRLRQDGTLAQEPELLARGGNPYFQVAAESAMRAVRRCAPYTMPAAKYDMWKDVEVTFDPRDMFRGG